MKNDYDQFLQFGFEILISSASFLARNSKLRIIFEIKGEVYFN